jgi:hypothetical protein
LRGKILPFQDYVKYVAANCRCKMRMSGLSKVEMSAFIEPLGRAASLEGRHGDLPKGGSG